MSFLCADASLLHNWRTRHLSENNVEFASFLEVEMNSKLTPVAFLVGAALLASCTSKNDNETQKKLATKPNIIVILADDMGYGDVGAYGQKVIKTPNLDSMANKGVLFTDFYAGSNVCGPSRATLMTGKHQGRARIRGNKGEYPLRDEDVTVAEMLKQADYHTGMIGKWGLGDFDSTGRPDKQGFDYYFGFLNHVHAHNHYPEWLWKNNQKVQLNNKVQQFDVSYGTYPAEVALPGHANEYADHHIFNESLAFIERAAKTKQPFFLYVNPVIPHANGDAKLADWTNGDGMEVPNYGEYADKTWPNPQKGFAAMINILDNGVGSIMNKLKELGIDDNTIVMFTSDNGPHKEGGNIPEYFDSNGVYKGIKRDAYDGGIRVPMIVWGPSIVTEGAVTDHISYSGDIMATAAEFAGVKLPAGEYDSVSFAPTLLGEADKQVKNNYLYWEDYFAKGAQAIRKGKWKAIREPIHTGKIALYDMSVDPSESIDVAKHQPKLVAEFAALMDKSHTPDPDWGLKTPKNKK